MSLVIPGQCKVERALSRHISTLRWPSWMVFRISGISVEARYYDAITLKYDPVLNCAIFSEVPEVA